MAGNNNDKRVVVCSNPTCQKKWVPGQPSFKSCSQCGQAKYCSKECQRSHWKQHKRACKKKAQQIQQQQNQSQQSIKSPQLSQSPQQQPQQNKKQNPSNSPQLKQGKKQQSPQLHNQSNKNRSPSPSKRGNEKNEKVDKDVKTDSNDQKKLVAEITALKREKQQLLLDKKEANFFLEQTKKTIAKQNEKMESFTERLRLTLNKVEKIHESLESVKAIC